MKIRLKNYFLIIFSFTIIVTGIVGIMSFVTLREMIRLNDRVQYSQKQMEILWTIRYDLAAILKESFEFYLFQGEEELEEFNAERSQLLEILDDYHELTEDEVSFVDDDDDDEDEEEAELRFIIELTGTVNDELDKISAVMANPSAVDDYLSRLEQLEELLDEKISPRIQSAIEGESDELSESREQTGQLYLTHQRVVLIGMFIILIILIVVVIMVTRDITRPIIGLAADIERIGEPGFHFTTELDSKNELGILARSIVEMNHRLEDTQAQLLQSARLASIGQLAAGIAHELNQPLMVVKMAAGLLEEPEGTGDTESERTLILRNVDRMAAIISNMKGFSRISTTRDRISVNRVLEDSLTMVSEEIRINRIDLIRDLSPEKPEISGNAGELEQVVLNLLTNALHAVNGNPDGKARTIHLRSICDEDAGQVVITVEDTGTGIPEKALSMIFDPFYTTKPVNEGTGLGLSISHSIIKRHQGNLRVVETSESGTTFEIRLPKAGDEHNA